MMIQVNRINEGFCELMSPEGKLIGTLYNVLEVNDIRLQIYKEQVSGYWFRWKGQKVDISKDGRIDNPKGFYDTFDNQINILIGL